MFYGDIDKGGKESKWEKKRRIVMEKTEIGLEMLREIREREETKKIALEITERLRKAERKERLKKVKISKYHNWYKKTKVVPEYLRGKKKKKERRLIARFRW